ncbi:sodium:solute symporter [Lacrimispora sp.]|uniref:sodium:solute symporter n=1 Tax=Lacrimispora sp. TaxID=2719234 RepID=UPI002FD9A459
MNENKNTNPNNHKTPPSSAATAASWSVILGGFGLVSSCIPLFSIWELPAGLFLGIAGTACAIYSKQGKPFTQQAQLGLILSVISTVCGLLMTFFIIFMYDIMESDTPLGRHFRETLEALSVPQE